MEKKNYNYLGAQKVGDKVVGHIEAWTKAMPEKQLLTHIDASGDKKELASLFLSGQYNEKQLVYLFGEDIKKVINKGYLTVKVVGFDLVAKGLKAYDPTLQQVLGFTGAFKLETSNSNGKDYTNLVCYPNAWKPVTKKNEEAGRVGKAYGTGTGTSDLTPEAETGDIPF